MDRRRLVSSLAASALLPVFAPLIARAQTGAPRPAGDLALTAFAGRLENPWGLAFLPDGRIMVTERPGRLRVIERDGRVNPTLAGVPNVVAQRQGGLLGIALDPRFTENRRVYLAFSERRGGDMNATSVARGRLNLAATALEGTEVIWRQEPAFASGFHFGSRLVFDRSGHLFVTTGDRFQLSQESQNPANTIAKIVRITTEGRPAPGNPAETGRAGWHPAVWSIGHRNVQAATLHPTTGELWIADHGPRGGDMLHVARAGRNHGWPLISYGTHYDGRPVAGGAREREGLEQPLTHWSPTSVAPSGATFYTGDLMPDFRGNLFLGALAGSAVIRIVVDGDRYIREERLFTGLGNRYRDVVQGPDGALWLITDAAEGQVLRLAPRGR